MRNSGTAPSASRDLAHQFVNCYNWPGRGLTLLKRHPHLRGKQTRLLLEQDAAWLLLPTCPGERHRSRAFGMIRAAALLEMCAGRPDRDVRRRIFALARSCKKTCQEHQARAEAIYLRIMRQCAEEWMRKEKHAPRRHGRVRVKFRRGNVALNYEQRDLDWELLARMPFEEVNAALRGMSLEEREAALDQITQPGGEIRIIREGFDPEVAVREVVGGIQELYL